MTELKEIEIILQKRIGSVQKRDLQSIILLTGKINQGDPFMILYYSEALLQAILKVIRCRISIRDRRLLLLIILSPIMSARSLKDLAETCMIGKNSLYTVLDSRLPSSWLAGIQREGISRLSSHVQRLKHADSSVRSRECITLCADDSTRTVCGDFGGLAHPCYSGAEKRAVKGLRTRALIAVIGEGRKYIILDVHVVPPKSSGPGRPRYSEGEWLIASLKRIESQLNDYGLSSKGCYLSVDSAYAAGYVLRYADDAGLKLVSEVKGSLKVYWQNILWLPANLYFFIIETLYQKKFRFLTGEFDTPYYRHKTIIRVYGEVLVVLMHIGGETKRFFTNDANLKSLTIRRVARRRWQLEQIFWNLKQLLGLPGIHNQRKNRVLVRIYLCFIFAQAIKDCSGNLNITMRKLHKILERNPQVLIEKINCRCASVLYDPANESSIQGLAA